MRYVMAVLTMLAVVASGPATFADVTAGPQKYEGSVEGNKYDGYQFDLNQGWATIRVHTTGDSLVKVAAASVADPKNILAVDTNKGGDAIISFYVPKAGAYVVIVSNAGTSADSYVLYAS